jgi:hypothetical protein
MRKLTKSLRFPMLLIQDAGMHEKKKTKDGIRLLQCKKMAEMQGKKNEGRSPSPSQIKKLKLNEEISKTKDGQSVSFETR